MRAEENECQRERRGPANDPVLASNTLFTENERGSANLRTEGSAEGHNYVWCSPRSPYHNCAVRTSLGKNPLSTPDGHSLRNIRENSERARKNPGRDHNLLPSSGSTRATPLRSRKFLARFAAPYYSGPNLNPQNCENAFSARDLSFLEFVVPYESGARRIASNLGSDLFCPLWLVEAAHLEWRARVARSCCIGRRWSVGCSPLVLDRSSWSVVGSFLKFGRNSTRCQYGGGNVLSWRGSSPSRLFGVEGQQFGSTLLTLEEEGSCGGNAFSRSLCSPTAIAVSRGLPLSTSVILMWSGRRSVHFGPQRARKCNTS